MRDALQELANSVDPTRIAEDDAIWKPITLEYIMACFEDSNMGGVGTLQTVKSVGRYLTVWEVLAGFQLTIRNIGIVASIHIDGGVCCLLGRTVAYRTCILQDFQFLHEFIHNFWVGKYPLNSGDDKFLTRWMVYHGWNTNVQVYTTSALIAPSPYDLLDWYLDRELPGAVFGRIVHRPTNCVCLVRGCNTGTAATNFVSMYCGSVRERARGL